MIGIATGIGIESQVVALTAMRNCVFSWERDEHSVATPINVLEEASTSPPAINHMAIQYIAGCKMNKT